MKNLTFTIVLLVGTCSSILSQSLAGKRIINGNFSLYLQNFNVKPKQTSTQTATSDRVTNFRVSFITGKIKENNTYVAYGLTAGVENSVNEANTTQHRKNLQLGPQIGMGKFVKVFDQFYYSPNMNFSLGVNSGSSKYDNATATSWGLFANASASPISFLYQFNNNFLLSAGFGSIALNYTSSYTSSDSEKRTYHNLNLSAGLNNFSGISVFYLFK